MRYLNPEFNTMEGAEEAIKRVVKVNTKYGNRLGMFAGIEKQRNSFIGWFILRPDMKAPEDKTNLEIGYRLFREFWGKGYGTEVSLALVKKLVRSLM